MALASVRCYTHTHTHIFFPPSRPDERCLIYPLNAKQKSPHKTSFKTEINKECGFNMSKSEIEVSKSEALKRFLMASRGQLPWL